LDHYLYGTCFSGAVEVFHLSQIPEVYWPGESLLLEVAADLLDAAKFAGHRQPQYLVDHKPTYRVLRTIERSMPNGPVRRRGLTHASSQQTVLSLILVYTDYSGDASSGSVCNASCWTAQTFATGETSGAEATVCSSIALLTNSAAELL
jgi:hypothetical protein